MSNLGVYQGSAATTVGLNSSTSILYQIAMLQNANEMKQLTFEEQATGVEDQNASTIALGDDQAKQTRLNAWGTIAGAATGLLIEGVMSGSAMIEQSGVDTLNNELTNVNSFKEGLLNSTPNEIELLGNENFENQSFADQLDQFASESTEQPSFKKDEFLSGNLSLEEKGALFNNKEVDYNAEAAAFSDNNKQAALDTSDRLQNNLETQIEQKNKKIQTRLTMGQSFSQTLNGLIKGSFEMASAETQVYQSEDQVNQNNAKFLTDNFKSMQDALNQQSNQAADMIEQFIQNMRAVAQSATSA